MERSWGSERRSCLLLLWSVCPSAPGLGAGRAPENTHHVSKNRLAPKPWLCGLESYLAELSLRPFGPIDPLLNREMGFFLRLTHCTCSVRVPPSLSPLLSCLCIFEVFLGQSQRAGSNVPAIRTAGACWELTSTFSMDPDPSSVHVLEHSTFTGMPWNGCHAHPHFKVEKNSDAEKLSHLATGVRFIKAFRATSAQACCCQSGRFNPRSPPSHPPLKRAP